MNKMTTVETWDHYNWEEQQIILKQYELEEKIGKFLEASISVDAAWGTTYIDIHQRIRTKGCKSFLLSYLLQKCGLKQIRVSREQITLIQTDKYSREEIESAMNKIMKHPEWIEDFREYAKDNKTMMDFTFNMTTEELKRYC